MTIENRLLSHELIRVGTYIGWPSQDFEGKGNIRPDVVRLVKAGFYFTGSCDTVRCFSCGLEIKDWKQHLDPYVVHANRSPQCAFIMGTCNSNTARSGCFPSLTRQGVVISNLEADEDIASDSSSLTSSDNLQSVHGEGEIRSPPQTNSSSPPSEHTPRSGISPGNNSIDHQHLAPAAIGEHVSRCQIPETNDLPETRRKSASPLLNTQSTNSRPHIHRARSDVTDVFPRKNSAIIANRQLSSSSFDRVKFQVSEEARIQTFTQWPGIRKTRAKEFARAGFVYIGPADRVQCAFCGGILRHWKSDDVPLHEHYKHFPGCSFAVESLSTIVVPRPKHSKYISERNRFNSFQNWDPSWNPKPEALANAGFYFTGIEDRVRCFFCNGALCNWEPGDDPWNEHARWYPRCPYVKQSKGQAFINGVLNSMSLADRQAILLGRTDPQFALREQARKVYTDKVMTLMDSPVVKTVLSLDVPKKLVKKAVKEKLAENGENFSSPDALLEAIFNYSMIKELDNEPEIWSQQKKKDEDGVGEPLSSRSKGRNFIWLAEENRLLKEQKQCKVCLDREVCVTFVPCGHLVCCSPCASALKLCPMCRTKIRGTIRTYMS